MTGHTQTYDPIAAALAEDIGDGDATVEFFIDPSQQAAARIFAKEPVVLAGTETAAEVFRRVEPSLTINIERPEGSRLAVGDTVLTVRGRAGGILTGERVALNFLQRLSGVATMTRRFVDAVEGTPAKILDTRKTTPGLRALEKAAVRAGGGYNHRMGLFDMVMVKDNHLLASSESAALQAAIHRARSARAGLRIELEADTLDQVRMFLGLEGVDVILLDNMSLDELRQAVALGQGTAVQFEASGGINLQTVHAIAQTGVQWISVGALTHSARAVDFPWSFCPAMARPDDPDVRLLRALRAATSDWGFLTSAELIAAADLGTITVLEECFVGLRAAGYLLEGAAESGWRLQSAPATLIADDLLATLPATSSRVIGREILVFEETHSTNDLAARAGDDHLAEGLVIFAEKQRAGRGRLGRVWESPPRQGLWFSVLLRPVSVPVERWPELTFCAALAVAETAEQQTGLPAKIKWPNDVLLGGRKIAGILLESHHRQSPGFVVVGIGVNVLQAETDFDPQLRTRAGSLAMMTADTGRHRIERRIVAASLLENLERFYTRWPENISSIMHACEQRGCLPPIS